MSQYYEIWPIDCRQAMQCMAPDSIDSCVTDPPYELTSIVKRFGGANAAPAQHGTDGAFQRASRGFMGQQWDGSGVAFDVNTWKEVYRVLRPGAYLLAFSGSRTYHRMVCAIEDAGFEIRDQIMWLYGSGFPKSHDVSKAIDKRAGAEREIKGVRAKNYADTPSGYGSVSGKGGARQGGIWQESRGDVRAGRDLTAPATPEAAQWQGWGTALKPAHEPIVVARKPLIGSVVENVLTYGTGGINIDACRVPYVGANDENESKTKNAHADFQSGPMANAVYGKFSKDRENYDPPGRFPANLIHDGSDEVLAGFPDSNAGKANPELRRHPSNGVTYGDEGGQAKVGHGDSGSAARFFYCAKASRADRNSGCEGLPEGMPSNALDRASQREGLEGAPGRGSLSGPRANTHPTVKPETLMRYLTRLVTPPGGKVLDPFAGSGSTGKAAIAEGFYPVLCEMTDEYLPILQARIDHAVKLRYAKP